LTLAALIVALIVPAPASAGGDRDANPCLKPEKRRMLFCPDLEMSPPENMFLTRSRGGRLRLHAGNSINSVGRGPAELRGKRTSRYRMSARQVIYRRGGGRRYLDTGAGLVFKAIPGQYRYWKYQFAAKFELWKLDKKGRRTKLVRTGPKIAYCLRDLERRNPLLAGSPETFHYPACNQELDKQRVTLGTSVGWSDVYPSTYHEQYLFVDGLRGCFAYVHIADPRNGIYESNERNNEGEKVVRLPWTGSRKNCPKSSRGVKPPVEGEDDGSTEAPSEY
jgi:hypothetical protein